MKRTMTREESRQDFKRQEREAAELKANPLIQYSTTQLKKELRRRKRNPGW